MWGRTMLLWMAVCAAGCGEGGTGRAVPCADGAAVPSGADYLVRGSLVHKRGQPYTYDGDFGVTADSHAIVELYYVLGEDAPSTTIAKLCIAGVTGLPIAFQIPGEPAAIYKGPGEYGLSARVLSGAGDELSVGDLLSEYRIRVSAAERDVTVEVTGIEACGTPQSGGFCTSRQ